MEITYTKYTTILSTQPKIDNNATEDEYHEKIKSMKDLYTDISNIPLKPSLFSKEGIKSSFSKEGIKSSVSKEEKDNLISECIKKLKDLKGKLIEKFYNEIKIKKDQIIQPKHHDNGDGSYTGYSLLDIFDPNLEYYMVLLILSDDFEKNGKKCIKNLGKYRNATIHIKKYNAYHDLPEVTKYKKYIEFENEKVLLYDDSEMKTQIYIKQTDINKTKLTNEQFEVYNLLNEYYDKYNEYQENLRKIKETSSEADENTENLIQNLDDKKSEHEQTIDKKEILENEIKILETKIKELKTKSNNTESPKEFQIPTSILEYNGNDETLNNLKNPNVVIDDSIQGVLSKANMVKSLIDGRTKGGKRINQNRKRSSRKTKRSSKKSKKSRRNRKR
jgi:sulfur relay (sulfurtransferase) DsrC/TusE family protein